MGIRQTTKSDIDAIMSIEHSAFPPNKYASREAMLRRIDLFPEGCYVVIHDGEIVGFTTALIAGDLKTLEELDPPDKQIHNSKGSVYYLRSIAISPKYQKNDYGRLLMEKQIQIAKGLSKNIMRLTSTDETAKFYEKLGFIRISEYNEFHGSVQAIWEMKLD